LQKEHQALQEYEYGAALACRVFVA